MQTVKITQIFKYSLYVGINKFVTIKSEKKGMNMNGRNKVHFNKYLIQYSVDHQIKRRIDGL